MRLPWISHGIILLAHGTPMERPWLSQGGFSSDAHGQPMDTQGSRRFNVLVHGLPMDAPVGTWYWLVGRLLVAYETIVGQQGPPCDAMEFCCRFFVALVQLALYLSAPPLLASLRNL